MKLKDIEVTSYDDCPLKSVCNSPNCGSPDYCILANLSEKEAEMEVEEYLDVATAYIDRRYEAEEKIQSQKRRRSESAKKASKTKFIIACNPNVLDAKRQCKKLLGYILSKQKELSFVSAMSIADKLYYGLSESPVVAKVKSELDGLEEMYKDAQAKLKEEKRKALREIHEYRSTNER